MPSTNLGLFFHPKAVALIGATEKQGSVGRAVLWNLIRSPFGGTVYPVHPKHPSLLGIKTYPSVAELPGPAELAIIVIPAEAVLDVVRQCAQQGIRGAIVISAGFRESGAHGAALEQALLEETRRNGMRLIGPNCLGVMSPISGFNATFAQTIARPGNVAFLSQSGAMVTAILDWSLREQVGFSACVSVGSMIDVNWGDLIDYFGNDPNTRNIVMYMESVGDARSFLSAAREVALNKPIIVIKAGRSEATAKAAASHTGALTGSDAVVDAAFRRAGVLRVNTIADVFYVTEVLAKQPRPLGPKLAIITNAGGPGVLAADALLSHDGQLATLSPETEQALDDALPPHWSHNNPIDVIGDAGPERYEKAIAAVAKDPGVDGLLVIMCPQALTDPVTIAERAKAFAKLGRKPIIASWMGGADATSGAAVLSAAGIPCFPFPDTAVRLFQYMWRYSQNLHALYETPSPAEQGPVDREGAGSIIRAAREAGREILSEAEAKRVLAAYGLPVVPTEVASSSDEAVELAHRFGFPVVLKLHSFTITHKAQAGGVVLNVQNEAAVREAFRAIQGAVPAQDFGGVSVQPMVSEKGYELIVGSTVDAQFGPVILFGAGGSLAEVLRDNALGLPPLNTTLARRLIERTRISKVLTDGRELERLLVAFSYLVAEQRWIKEIDINPLLALPDRLVALDARIILHAAAAKLDSLPTIAIRPYPTRYERRGPVWVIRPIRPEDEPKMVRFHETLSETSVYRRYFHVMGLSQRVDHERLTRMCFIDYDRQMALVAENAEGVIGGVGRLVRVPATNQAEVAVIVSDHFQKQGLGTELVRQLIDFARDEHIGLITATVLEENIPMQKVFRGLGFEFRWSAEEQGLLAELKMVN